MVRNFFRHRLFCNASWVGMLLLLLGGVLAGCGSGSGRPPSHPTSFEGKLSLLKVPNPYSLPGRIVRGPDSHLWFPAIAYGNFGTNQPSGAIGRLTPDGTFHMFAMPTANSYPTEITVGPDGNLWFPAVQGDGQVVHGTDTPPRFRSVRGEIGKLTLDGKFSTFALPSPQSYAVGITAGPDGNLWFTEVVDSNTASINKIGRLTPSGAFTEYALTTLDKYDSVGPIITGPDGNLWFAIDGSDADYNSVGKMGRMTPQGTLKVFTLGKFVLARDLTVGPDHNLWFSSGLSIGRLTTNGQLQTFKPSSNPNNQIFIGGITVGTDGALWFATANVALGRVTTDGTFKFYPFPDNTYFDNGSSSLRLGELKGIASGADGTFWLTDGGQIGHVV